MCRTSCELVPEVAFGEDVNSVLQVLVVSDQVVGLRSHGDARRLQSVVESKAVLRKRHILPSRTQHLSSHTVGRVRLSAFC